MKFIRIPILNAIDPEEDATVFLQTETIFSVMTATKSDRKRRSEINAIVVTSHGNYATSLNPSVVVEKINQSEFAPETES